MTAVSLRGVSKEYEIDGQVLQALHEVDLDVAPGEFVALVGPSGCGKTTLLRIVAGLEPPSAGRVSVGGSPIVGAGADRVLVFQRPNLFPWLSAEDNVAFGLRMAGRNRAECRSLAGKALERVGLRAFARSYPHELSGGMQQRVALARALVLDPPVLLLDEPLAALDALLRGHMQRALREWCAGRTAVLVTHSVREALVVADRVVVLTPRPGAVQCEFLPPGTAPRRVGAALARLEAEIEGTLGETVSFEEGAERHPVRSNDVIPSASEGS